MWFDKKRSMVGTFQELLELENAKPEQPLWLDLNECSGACDTATHSTMKLFESSDAGVTGGLAFGQPAFRGEAN